MLCTPLFFPISIPVLLYIIYNIYIGTSNWALRCSGTNPDGHSLARGAIIALLLTSRTQGTCEGALHLVCHALDLYAARERYRGVYIDKPLHTVVMCYEETQESSV